MHYCVMPLSVIAYELCTIKQPSTESREVISAGNSQPDWLASFYLTLSYTRPTQAENWTQILINLGKKDSYIKQFLLMLTHNPTRTLIPTHLLVQ